MKRVVITWVLVAVVALVPALGILGATPAYAAKHGHKNLQEALEHLEKHSRDMLEALKAGYKVDPKVEKAIIKDTEHVKRCSTQRSKRRRRR